MAAPLDPFYAQLGRQVRQHRIAKGWSQQQLGAAMKPGVTRASIANVEAGTQRLLAHTAVEMARALDIPVTALLPIAEPAAHASQSPEGLAADLANKLGISSSEATALVSRILQQKDQEP